MSDKKIEGVTPDEILKEEDKVEYLSALSVEFERDSRRYNRAFTEESEVGTL